MKTQYDKGVVRLGSGECAMVFRHDDIHLIIADTRDVHGPAPKPVALMALVSAILRPEMSDLRHTMLERINQHMEEQLKGAPE